MTVDEILQAAQQHGAKLSVHGGRLAACPARRLFCDDEERLLERFDEVIATLGDSGDEPPPPMTGAEGGKWLVARRSAPPRRILKRVDGNIFMEEVHDDA